MPLFEYRPTSIGGHRRARRAFVLTLVVGSALWGIVVWWAGHTLHEGNPYAFWLRLLPAILSPLGTIVFVLLLAGDYRTEVVSAWIVALCSAAGGYPYLYGILHESMGLPTRAALLAAGAGTVATAVAMRLWVRKHARERLREPQTVDAFADLDEAVAEARRQGNKFSLARALSRRSTLLDRPDDLAEATDLLQAAAAELPPDDVVRLFGAAFDLVTAMQAKYTRSDDLTGYSEALHLMRLAVSKLPGDREAHAMQSFAWAEYLLAQTSTADEVAEKILVSDAIRQLWMVLHRAGPALLRQLGCVHGMLGELAYLAGEISDEEAIALCRKGQRVAGWVPARRAQADVALAWVLLAAARAPADLTRAIRLFRRAAGYGTPKVRLDALTGYARAVAEGDAIGLRPRPARRIAAAWAAAYSASINGTSQDVLRICADWVGWAESIGDPKLCADAYQSLMVAIPFATEPQYQSRTKNELLGRVQNRAEEAGWWMLRVDDPAGAVVALELGRAVAMREVTGRTDPAVEGALLEAGRADLAGRYRTAARALDLAERGQGDSDRFTSGLQRAAATFAEVRRQIDALGLEDDTELDRIRRAAVEGPLVYLAAAEAGGYAVIVRASGDPEPVPLPFLTRAAARQAVDDLENTDDPRRIERLAEWLWHFGLGELDYRLGHGELVTIVPVGLMGLLPVHIAALRDGEATYGWKGLADRNDFRYAPNARILRTSLARAAGLASMPPAVIAVAAPASVGESRQVPLAFVLPEVVVVARLWRQRTDAVTVLPHATGSAVLDQLSRHSVWHFACHGRAAPDQILESSLQLADGSVTLRDLLRLAPGVRRLAVLSSCESHRIGHELPDEVVGLPGGMLQLGLAGVVAAHWEVNDRAAALLMARFHDLHAVGGLSPARALNEAQRWLRRATPAELRAAYPELAGGRTPRFASPFFWGAFTLTGA
ncbi:MAG TPA: CHAT domain-containing protein [Actinoplanes sp.]|nr:CHAT domain-containing protein [Actinoplanes sp.]